MVRKGVFGETFQLILDDKEGVSGLQGGGSASRNRKSIPKKSPKDRLHLHNRMAL